MGDNRVWVDINARGLPRSAIGGKPSLGDFVQYVPASGVAGLIARLRLLAESWAEFPGDQAYQNCASDLLAALPEPGEAPHV